MPSARPAKGSHSHPTVTCSTSWRRRSSWEDTPDQQTTVAAVKKDMESDQPMDRLVCGDVGFGKTEVAIRAAFKAAVDGKQVAVLVPTTILALQHYRSFIGAPARFPGAGRVPQPHQDPPRRRGRYVPTSNRGGSTS